MGPSFSTNRELIEASISLRLAELRLLAAWTCLRFERLRQAERARLVGETRYRPADGPPDR